MMRILFFPAEPTRSEEQCQFSDGAANPTWLSRRRGVNHRAGLDPRPNLLLHCGARAVERKQVGGVPTPRPTDSGGFFFTYQPSELLQSIKPQALFTGRSPVRIPLGVPDSRRGFHNHVYRTVTGSNPVRVAMQINDLR